MYYEYMSFVINKLQELLGLEPDVFLPIDEIVEHVDEMKIRPSITYGNNTDWSNVRRDEDWILTFQFFVPHGTYMDLRLIGEQFKKIIIKNCGGYVFQDKEYTVTNISFSSQFETDYKSLSININVNTKEIII